MDKIPFVTLTCALGHFTAVFLVTWPMNSSEAGGNLALIQTSLLFSSKCQLVSIRTTWFTQQKQWGLHQNKITSSLAAIQRPSHWTVKWFIVDFKLNNSHMLNFKTSTQGPYLIALSLWSSRPARCSRSGTDKETHLKKGNSINIQTVTLVQHQ